MPNEAEGAPARDVRFTPEFKRNLRQLARKYRIIYYAPTECTIVLITLYPNTEQQDIEAHEIHAILQEDVNARGAEIAHEGTRQQNQWYW